MIVRILDKIDLFDVWRWLLAIVCTVYTIVVTARTLWSWLVYFGSSRETMVMGRYATLLLLRARLRRFRAELLRIAGLLALFGAILWLHWVWL